MKLIASFFRLVRWPNLVFIAITQILFVYCIVYPLFKREDIFPNIHGVHFALLVLSSVFIAAGGYIINDYFDLNIDLVNKPDRLVVDKVISRRWVIVWHLVLSITGVALGGVIDVRTGTRFLSIANLITVVLLFLYSISLKKKLLSGNILISLLTAWVILVITWCEASNLINTTSSTVKVTRISILYAGFAFIISLVREVVKDMEDIEGDRRYGCYTMPIAWGINASKVFVSVWLVVLVVALLIVQFYVLQFGWYFSAAYCILFTIVPLFFIFKKLVPASRSSEFHQLSSWIKLAMFTGILSMVFFRIYL